MTAAKQIEEASCGAEGCGVSNRLSHAPLRPEEGCNVSKVGAGASGGIGLLALLASLSLLRRRARGLRVRTAPETTKRPKGGTL